MSGHISLSFLCSPKKDFTPSSSKQHRDDLTKFLNLLNSMKGTCSGVFLSFCQFLRGFCHHKHLYSPTNTWLDSVLIVPGHNSGFFSAPPQKIFNFKAEDAAQDFSMPGVPRAVIPGVPFTSHDNCRVLYPGSDEVHSNHCCQIIHTHLVDTGIQLYFIEEPARIPEQIFHIRGGRLQKASLLKKF